MPKGVYAHNSPKQRAQSLAALEKGRTREAREKATESLRRLGQDEDWRSRVGEGTKRAMADPEVRIRHAEGIRRAIEARRGFSPTHGNGQEPGLVTQLMWEILEPKGFVREHSIPTKSAGIPGLPLCYKVDFGHPARRIAVELDGPYHRQAYQRRRDAKKDNALRALGWTVLRISHK